MKQLKYTALKSTGSFLTLALGMLVFISIFFFSACRKETGVEQGVEENEFAVENLNGHLKQTKTFSSEVALKWLELQWRIFSQSGRPANENPSRHLSYTGIALYESVLPGMPSYQTLAGQLTDMPAMPHTEPGKAYHWPSAANAAQAYLNRNLLPTTTAANKNAIDSLASAQGAACREQADMLTYQRSVAFGEAVAKIIFEWSKSDRFLELLNAQYALPVGPGLWEPTPFGPARPSGPFWGEGRLLMPGVLAETFPAAPITYSTDPASPFFQAVKEVYDAAAVLNAEQMNQASYWRNAPQPQWMGILAQIFREQADNIRLDKAALAIAKMGIATNDVRIICWKAKFQYNRLRPVTYIRSVMGYPTWNSLTPTAPQPEYPSGHASWFATGASVMTEMFGENYAFTDHTKAPLFAPLSFSSFNEAAVHGGFSRFYLGMNTRSSVQTGIDLGNKTVEYMVRKIRFLK
jgi:hypothetical protein